MSVTQCPECGGCAAMKEAAHFVCQDCGWDNQKPWAVIWPKPVKRVRTSDATNDIENAFTVWREAAKRDLEETGGADLCGSECAEAKATVDAWLAQVSADQRQLHAALLACQAMAAVTDYSDFDKVHAARKLAMDAMAGG